MLRKKSAGATGSARLSAARSATGRSGVNRRDFLKNSGIAVGGLAGVATLTGAGATQAMAQEAGGGAEIIKSVCTHCSVGCTVLAEVSDGVWTGQEPAFDSPFNLGAHCAKGLVNVLLGVCDVVLFKHTLAVGSRSRLG